MHARVYARGSNDLWYDLRMESIEQALARAERLEAAADRAFQRWFTGQVQSSSGAASMQAKAEEARADVRFHPDYDPDVHGDA